MNVIDTATKRLIAFLEASDERVFALKGPWGAGKSFFVRDVLGCECSFKTSAT
jgi:tRNA A37 threonylcarbamoyladenosine biosynthesis protein TsaE